MELGRFFGPIDLLEPTDLALEHLFVEEKQCAERLVLRRSRNVHVSREVREKPRHFLFRHFSGVTFAMEKNKALNPIDVSLLGANTVMSDANDIAHLVEQFGFVFRRRAGYRSLHDADSAVFNPKLK